MPNKKLYHILFVEDDELIRSIYSERLAKESDFQVDTAVDGLDGLNKIKEKDYDLIFSGIQMPNMTGFELFQKMQGNAKWIEIPFVIFSHLGRAEDVQKAHDLQIQHFIVRGNHTPNDIAQKLHDIVVEKQNTSLVFKKSRILIVEDDPAIRDVYIECFQAESSFLVDSAVDGLEGLQKIRNQEYDLIFSGIQMPNMTGFELFQAVRNDSTLKQSPFVLFSHLGRSEDMARAENLKVDHFIVRGQTSPHDIVSKIKDILNVKDRTYNLLLSKDSPDYAEFIEAFWGADCIDHRDSSTMPVLVTLQQPQQPYVFSIELDCDK